MDKYGEPNLFLYLHQLETQQYNSSNYSWQRETIYIAKMKGEFL